MRAGSDIIWDTWNSGGPFVGELRPTGRVTVEWDWFLTKQANQLGTYPQEKRPVRWYQECDHDIATEQEVPNIKSINIDRSIDTDAASCTIVMYNNKMKGNLDAQPDLRELGMPGFYTIGRGMGAEANARWPNQELDEDWVFALSPNTLLRTYQGYGGSDGTIEDAVATGYLVRTGTWLADRVRIGTDGLITVECRDMAKLLIEQQLYPPLVPKRIYPLRYCRFEYRNETVTSVQTVPGATPGDRRAVYVDSTVDRYYGANKVLHGHTGTDSLDGDPSTFALSVGNASPERPFCADWWQYECGEEVNAVYVNPWAGNYTLYVSIMENGDWVDEGAGIIPWEPDVTDTEADIPFVAQFGVPWETPQEYVLPRKYLAENIRITFRDHTKSQWGPYFYRCGVREFKALISANGPNAASSVSSTQTVTNRYDGNYTDYSDIVKDVLLWAGFWCKETLGAGEDPHVHGNIESTGVYAEECLPDELFDKRPVMDVITELKETVGYVFWVDEDGGARFESPNWWAPGNFDEFGLYTDFIPDVDERTHLIDYSVQGSDEGLRSEIIISTADPQAGLNDVVTTRHVPPSNTVLRGMVVPAMWINGAFVNKDEQQIMAEMIAMHIYFRCRQSSVTMAANPCLQVNDQVRVYERNASDTFIHYVRGISSSMDCDTGDYTMTLTTHWLGHENDWMVSR